MDISIVIPLYNKAPYIERTLRSVLAQTHDRWECLVVDDGSTDGGAAIVRAQSDPRIRLLTQPNAGVAAARNRGAREARHPFVAFLDADDEWSPAFLHSIATLIQIYPQAVLYATAYAVETKRGLQTVGIHGVPADPAWTGVVQDYFQAAALSTDPPPNSSSVCVNRAAFFSSGGFSESRRLGEDIGLWITLARLGPLAYSSTVGAVYHRDDVESNTFGAYYGRANHFDFLSLLRDAGAAPPGYRAYLAKLVCRQARAALMNGYREDAVALTLDFPGKERFLERLLIRLAAGLPRRVLAALRFIKNIPGRIRIGVRS
ncbi:MAG: glycosyltransferase [Acidobacteriota bacterium]|nr:glycosyltransferase [Acidobacteriota bacterium]